MKSFVKIVQRIVEIVIEFGLLFFEGCLWFFKGWSHPLQKLTQIATVIGVILLICLVLAAAWAMLSAAFAGPAEFIWNLVQTNPAVGIPLFVMGLVFGLVLLFIAFIALGSS